jgi:hypothetical protein
MKLIELRKNNRNQKSRFSRLIEKRKNRRISTEDFKSDFQKSYEFQNSR